MTENEKRQPATQFIETGKSSYRMGIHISGNPYKDQPYRDLWEKGWRTARKLEESKRPENKRPPFKQQADERKHRHPKPQERKKRSEPQYQDTVNTDRLVARFNRRNRTVN